jgi:hypothetical protein
VLEANGLVVLRHVGGGHWLECMFTLGPCHDPHEPLGCINIPYFLMTMPSLLQKGSAAAASNM